MFDIEQPLSEEGAERRERILVAAQEAAARRRRGRQVRRGIAAGAVLLIVMVSAFFLHHPVKMIPTVVRDPAPPVVPATMVAKVPTYSGGPVIGWIKTDPTITERLGIRGARMWRTIDDEQLLRALADAGKPAGLVALEGRIYLIPQ